MTNKQLQDILSELTENLHKNLNLNLGESMSLSQTIETAFKQVTGHFYLEYNDYLFNDMEREIKIKDNN